MPLIYLRTYLQDQDGNNLSLILSQATLLAAKRQQDFMIIQLSEFKKYIKRDDLLTEFLTQDTYNQILLSTYPYLDHFVSEFFIRYNRLNITSHYWRNRQANTPVCLEEIMHHIRGMHTRQFLGGLFTMQYSGATTRYEVEPLNIELRLLFFTSNTAFKNTLTIFIVSQIRSARHGASFPAMQQEISTYLNRQPKNIRPRHPNILNHDDLISNFPTVDWNKEVEVTSWSRVGINGFFSGGKIKISLIEYLTALHKKDIKKYIKICSAQNEEQLKNALGQHRLGFIGDTTGMEIYKLAKVNSGSGADSISRSDAGLRSIT